MTGGEIDIRFVASITPDVVTDSRVHVLARRVQIFLVAFNLIDEGTFGDRDPDIVLLTALLCRRWWWIACQSPHVADGALPKFSMGGMRTLAQFSKLFVGDINTRMNAH